MEFQDRLSCQMPSKKKDRVNGEVQRRCHVVDASERRPFTSERLISCPIQTASECFFPRTACSLRTIDANLRHRQFPFTLLSNPSSAYLKSQRCEQQLSKTTALVDKARRKAVTGLREGYNDGFLSLDMKALLNQGQVKHVSLQPIPILCSGQIKEIKYRTARSLCVSAYVHSKLDNRSSHILQTRRSSASTGGDQPLPRSEKQRRLHYPRCV